MIKVYFRLIIDQTAYSNEVAQAALTELEFFLAPEIQADYFLGTKKLIAIETIAPNGDLICSFEVESSDISKLKRILISLRTGNKDHIHLGTSPTQCIAMNFKIHRPQIFSDNSNGFSTTQISEGLKNAPLAQY